MARSHWNSWLRFALSPRAAYASEVGPGESGVTLAGGRAGRYTPFQFPPLDCANATHERRHAHPVRHRARRPARGQPALAAGLRRVAPTGGGEAGPGEAGPDAPGHRFGP